MQTDYIIVGLGLAGLAFTKELDKNKKSYLVFEDNSQNSSLVAGGVYNPLVLKRFTPVWNATEQLNIALPFYRELEIQFNKKYDYKIDIYRVFKSVEEQNNWFAACDNLALSNYMDSKLIKEKHEGVLANFDYGKLLNTGRIDTKSLLEDYRNYLSQRQLIRNESFQYEALKINQNTVEYKDVIASKIVFCEGFGLKNNPFFNELPMQEVKGELITIHAPNLNVDFLIKSALFVFPLGDNLYKVGATFNWKDKTQHPTEEGKIELTTKLETFITVPYTIVERVAGLRPTVKDRRPLAGNHPKHPNLAVLNGLGTRGVMIAPTLANALYNYLENGIALDKEISIDRFL